jgi:hypothetical protein
MYQIMCPAKSGCAAIVLYRILTSPHVFGAIDAVTCPPKFACVTFA